ncbi:SemiSWEET transporter [Atopomonas sediminilitoris]|uniref:SemiSWEET transporter n=1 Tax=Atopomonas sediminilitoris TaxID=2919919 RepID=UPI001F4E1CD1|nr:SemiSWEET transporter [Atopomonas sediminilitoris]MCJ8168906.1 SemiSWEET transporter [Atopomonas sediminilitoris]
MALEWIGYLAAVLTTAAFLPQTVLTIRTRDTQGLSLGMYSLFTTGVACWLVYGVVRGDWALILANGITLLLAATILSLKLLSLRRA